MNERLSSKLLSPKSNQKWTKQNEKKIKKDLPILIFNRVASTGGGGGWGRGQRYFCKQNSQETNAEKDQTRNESYFNRLVFVHRERDGRKTRRSECENPCILPIATPATRPSEARGRSEQRRYLKSSVINISHLGWIFELMHGGMLHVLPACWFCGLKITHHELDTNPGPAEMKSAVLTPSQSLYAIVLILGTRYRK